MKRENRERGRQSGKRVANSRFILNYLANGKGDVDRDRRRVKRASYEGNAKGREE